MMRCKYCEVRVIPLVFHEDSKVIGKGEPPEFRHDPKATEDGPTCGRSGLRESDIEDVEEEA
jgi:hypothetical protein